MSVQQRNSKRNLSNSSYQSSQEPVNRNPQQEAKQKKYAQQKVTARNSQDIQIKSSIPGPGQYNPKYPESNKTTLIHAKQYNVDKEQINKPGPGDYKIEQSQLSKIGFKIGNEKRYKEQIKRSPGPGDYETASKSHAPSFKVGKQSRSERNVFNTIGPGQYNIPSLIKVNTGIKMAPRRQQTIQIITPGPDAYQISKQQRVRSFKIGTSKRDGIFKKSISPGPGDYSVEIFRDQAGYSIGRSQRSDKKIDQLPGPGSYHLIKPTNAPKYTIYQKLQQRSEKIGPGPQTYTIGDFKETRTVIFGRAKRDDHNYLVVPGPGEYDTDKIRNKPQVSIVFGREKRSQSCSENSQIPGPGQYEISNTFYAKKK